MRREIRLSTPTLAAGGRHIARLGIAVLLEEPAEAIIAALTAVAEHWNEHPTPSSEAGGGRRGGNAAVNDESG